MSNNSKRYYRLHRIFSLQEDQADRKVIEARIIENSKVTGTNMYILILAILIASIGLNMNSTPVVIGAMLISPLMSGLIAIADGIANHDLREINQGFRRFLFQIIVSIITSTIYFKLSPMSGFSDELFARTQPTFWDVLIATCGGFAAIIANTRKNIVSNVIPGAAIATALMPPLCTVGYCLSTTKWMYAAGAFYLFLINSVFIIVAGVLGLYMMGLTKSTQLISNRKRFITALIIIGVIAIPSAIMGSKSVQNSVVKDHYEKYIQREFNFENTAVVKSNINIQDQTITVALLGDYIPSDEIKKIEDRVDVYELDGYSVRVTQTAIEQGMSEEEVRALLEKEEKDILSETEENKAKLEEALALVDLQNEAREQRNTAINELLLLYPSVHHAGFSDMRDSENETNYVLVLETSELLNEEQITTIECWMKIKLKMDNKDLSVIQIEKEYPQEEEIEETESSTLPAE